MRLLVFVTLACLSACGGFPWRKTQAPDPTGIVVTGAPMASVVFIDGVQAGPATGIHDHAQVLHVAAGDHTVEIHVGDRVVYREEAYVGPGEHYAVRVLSGFNR